MQVYTPRQEAQRAALARDLGVDLLCALVNNNSRCYDESLDFADHMEAILPVGQGVSMKRQKVNPRQRCCSCTCMRSCSETASPAE